MTDDRLVLAACPLRPSPHVVGWPGACDWCGTHLHGRRTRWCRDTCRQTFLSNHYWQFARTTALNRDGCCLRCGYGPRLLRDLVLAHNRETGAHVGLGFDWRGGAHLMNPAGDNILHLRRYAAAWALEVNHRTPLADLLQPDRDRHGRARGRHGQAGCHHHQANLETLCHECHTAETTAQRRRRARRPTKTVQGSLA